MSYGTAHHAVDKEGGNVWLNLQTVKQKKHDCVSTADDGQTRPNSDHRDPPEHCDVATSVLLCIHELDGRIELYRC